LNEAYPEDLNIV